MKFIYCTIPKNQVVAKYTLAVWRSETLTSAQLAKPNG